MRWFLPVLLLLGGCQYLTKGVDRASDVFVGQIQEYCENAYHRRLAIYIFIEGELKPYGHTISVYCKGDAEAEADIEVEEELNDALPPIS